MGKVTRRDFIVKGGRYALFTASAMQVLFTSKRAMAQSGLARFVVSVDPGQRVRGSFSPITARSPSATWIANLEYYGNNHDYRVAYHVYSIGFENAANLPANVQVSVAVTNSGFNSFYWGQAHFPEDFPKTGGTVGNGGTVINLPNHNRPLIVIIPPLHSATGTITFSAPGVETLTLTVVYNP